MESLLVLEPSKCNGCSTCEIVCSLKHEEECNPVRSRIRIVKDASQGIFIPIMCQQCEKAICKDVCPTNAIFEDPKLGILVDEKACLGCRLCTLACPIGSVTIDYIRKAAVKCDLCEGDPLCTKFCPTEAIKYVKRDKVSLMRKQEGIRKLSDFMSLILTEREEGV